MTAFTELGLGHEICTALAAQGYQTPTPIQAAAIPKALAGHDLLAAAQTGTGKTAAFMLPSLERLKRYANASASPAMHPVRMLVLTPTRELADQIDQNTQNYIKNMPLRHTVLFGGVNMNKQTADLRAGCEIVIATVGRLLDHVKQKNINLSKVEIVVLDEADRMLDMGFIDDIRIIMQMLPKPRQTLLFSATWDGAVGKLARKLTKNPEVIEIERAEAQGKIEEQLLYCDDRNHKNRLLDHILRDANIDQCVIFTATKAMTETLADELYEKGFAANCLHGDMPQGWRNRTLMDVRKGRCKILVATDVAARGIDVPTITHVINYDLPKQAEDYVHRIGRTGRAGRTGIAVSFADAKEYMMVHKIERYINRKLPEIVIEGMEPTRKRNKNAERKPKGKGGWGGGKRGEGERWGSHDKKPFGEKKFGGKREGGFKKEGFKKDGFKAKPKGKFRD